MCIKSASCEITLLNTLGILLISVDSYVLLFYLCYSKLFGNLPTTVIICNFVSENGLRKQHCCSRALSLSFFLFFPFFLSFFFWGGGGLHSDPYGFSYGILVRYASGVSPVVCVLYA